MCMHWEGVHGECGRVTGVEKELHCVVHASHAHVCICIYLHVYTLCILRSPTAKIKEVEVGGEWFGAELVTTPIIINVLPKPKKTE